MSNAKGIAILTVMLTTIVACVVGGIISAHYLGPDNAIEEELEEIAEHEAEILFHQPEGSLKEEMDVLFTHKKD